MRPWHAGLRRLHPRLPAVWRLGAGRRAGAARPDTPAGEVFGISRGIWLARATHPEVLAAAQDGGLVSALAILDGSGLLDHDGHVRIGAVRRQLEPRLHLIPRFRQLLYRPRLGLGWPLWVDALAFDLADHVRVFPLAAPGDQAQLLAACEQLRRRRLDPSRPLWEVWLLPGLAEGRVGLFLRAHHALADGIAGMVAFGALLDLAADAPAPAAEPWTPAPIPSAGQLFRDNLRQRLQGLARALSGLIHQPGRCGGRGGSGRRGGSSSPSSVPH